MDIILRSVADPSITWLVQERAEIGRLRGCDIELHDPSISKLHAIIERTRRGYLIADLGSKNGTRINGIAVDGSTDIGVGDRVSIGNLEFIVDLAGQRERTGSGAETALLLKLCQSLLLAPDLDEVLRVALDQFVGLTRADRGALLLLEDGRLSCQLGRQRSRDGHLEDLSPAEFEFTETLASQVVAEGQSRIVFNAIEDDLLRSARSVVALGVSGAVCIPLLAPRWGGAVEKLGVLYGDSVRSIVSAVPLELLESIGSIIALAIESARNQRDLQSQSALLEMKVEERTRELELKHRQLLESEKMAATGLLAAGVAHELGNALLQVSANVKMIHEFSAALAGIVGGRAPEMAARREEVLELVQDLACASRLCLDGAAMSERTVRDLKSFARLDEAKLKLVHLDEALETVVRLVSKGVGRDQRFELQLGRLPPVWCYPERMNQVFLNLFVNAVHASFRGGVIRAGSRMVPGEFHYFIEDEGSGIEAEILHRIFDPFFTTKKVGEGSGLGLSLAYQTAKEHGGRIEVDSAPGEGSCFRIVLPDSLREQPPTGSE